MGCKRRVHYTNSKLFPTLASTRSLAGWNNGRDRMQIVPEWAKEKKNRAKPVPPALSPGRCAACTPGCISSAAGRTRVFSHNAKVIVAEHLVHSVRWACGENWVTVYRGAFDEVWTAWNTKWRARMFHFPALIKTFHCRAAFLTHFPHIEVPQLYRREKKRPQARKWSEHRVQTFICYFLHWFRRRWGRDASVLIWLISIELWLVNITLNYFPDHILLRHYKETGTLFPGLRSAICYKRKHALLQLTSQVTS